MEAVLKENLVFLENIFDVLFIVFNDLNRICEV